MVIKTLDSSNKIVEDIIRGINMNFGSKKMLIRFLMGNCYEIGRGSQGVAYYNMGDGYVYKIFYEFFDNEMVDEYDAEQILKFRNVPNDTFAWAVDTLYVEGNLVGYKTPYIQDKTLNKHDPLTVNLEQFTNCLNRAKADIELISKYKILTFDIMYNILYGNKISIIDHLEYSISNDDYKSLYKNNNNNFDLEIYFFLVDGYFNEFVNSYSDLKELYSSKEEDVLVFLKLFKKYLSEYIGKPIVTLKDAKECLNKNESICFYQRELYQPIYKRLVK